ncbi:MAG: S26 family signal peptidase [Terriglobia bacterium]
MRLSRTMLISAVACAVVGIAASAPRTPLLVWNATASAPLGLYFRTTGSALKKDDLVLVHTPARIAGFAAQRGYLPMHVPLIKRAAAISGDVICAKGDTVWLNGKVFLHRRKADSKGRTLPQWSGCNRLRSSDVFLAMANVRDSFDGRYFGPISTSNIVGHLVPLWTH